MVGVTPKKIYKSSFKRRFPERDLTKASFKFKSLSLIVQIVKASFHSNELIESVDVDYHYTCAIELMLLIYSIAHV